jgi:hypothetical protein
MNPNRVHAHGTFKLRYLASDGFTRMGDYSGAMTVRELLDLVECFRARR